MSTPPTVDNLRHCPACGAYVDRAWTKCWLCGAQLDAAGAIIAKSIAPIRAPSHPVSGYSLQSLMLFVTLTAVVLGLSAIVPGLGIPLGVVLFVVWLRTAAVVTYRRAHGKAVTRTEKLHLFLNSFGVTTILLIVTSFASIGAFFVSCLAAFAASGGGAPDAFSTPVFFVILLVPFTAAMVVIVRKTAQIVRQRWRRDIGR